MTTSSVSSVLAHVAAADFRLWSKQISDQLAAVGLTKTADTGQIDFTTVAFPGTGVVGGYEIWRFNDTLQATFPIFLKIEYGTSGSGSNYPGMWLTVGSGSNGAGTLTGVMLNRVAHGRATTLSGSPTVSYASYNTAIGFLGFAGWLSGSAGAPYGYLPFMVMRPVDDTGAPTAEGIVTYYLSATSFVSSVYSAVSGSVVMAGNIAYTLVPSNAVSSVVGTDVQLFRHFCGLPRVRHLPGICTYFDAEISRGTQFPATLVGTQRTYVALGNGFSGASQAAATAHVPAMVYE